MPHPPKKKGTMEWPLLTILQVSPSSLAAKSSSSKTTILPWFETGDYRLDGAKTPVISMEFKLPTPQSTGDFPGISETSTGEVL